MGPRRTPVLFVLVLLVVSALPLPTPAQGNDVRTDPIDVDGGDALADVDGVTGAGTASDPYVLSGFTLDAGDDVAIRITGVDAHVVIRGVILAGRTLVEAADIRHLVIEDVAGTSVHEAFLLRDIGDLTLAGATVDAAGAVAVLANTSGDVRDVVATGRADGVVLNDFTGTLEEVDLAVRGNGLIAHNFTGEARNLTIEGFHNATTVGTQAIGCGGTGVTFTGGRPQLEGAVVSCNDVGVAIHDAEDVNLSRNVIDLAETGLTIRNAVVAVGNDVYFARDTAIRVTESRVLIEGAAAIGLHRGLDADGSVLDIADSRFTGGLAEGIRMKGGTLADRGVTAQDAATGIRLDGVDATIAKGGATTVITGVRDGLRVTGGNVTVEGTLRVNATTGEGTAVTLLATNAGRDPWGRIEVDEAHHVLDLDVGAVVRIGNLTVDDSDGWVAQLDHGSHLALDQGWFFNTGRPGDAYRLRNQSVLTTANVTIDDFWDHLLDAEDAAWRDDGSTVRPFYFLSLFGSAATGFAAKATRTDLHLNGTSFTFAGTSGFLVQDPRPTPDGSPPAHVVIRNVTIVQDGGAGFVLENVSALFEGGEFESFTGGRSDGGAHGIHATRGAAFVLDGIHVHHYGDAGARVDDLTKLPVSTLFPPKEAGSSETHARLLLEGANLSSNLGAGFSADGVPKDVGLRIANSTFHRNVVGIDLDDTAATLTGNEIGWRRSQDPNVCFEFRSSDCRRSQDVGLRSMWSGTGAEDVSVVGNLFQGDFLGIHLTGHGEGVLVDGNVLDNHYDGILVDGVPRDSGPLVTKNLLREGAFHSVAANDYCHVDVNGTTAQVVRNLLFDGGNRNQACGVIVRDGADADVWNNDLDGQGVGVIVQHADADVRGNTITNYTRGGIWVLGAGAGAESLVVSDNTVLAHNESGSAGLPGVLTDLACLAPPSSTGRGEGICWWDVTGDISYNRLETTADYGVYLPSGATHTPEVFNNRIQGDVGLWVPSDLAPSYDEANRIRGNLFSGLSGDDTPVAIVDGRWGSHSISGTDPDPDAQNDAGTPEAPNTAWGWTITPTSGGMNVANNAYALGPLVECHAFLDHYKANTDSDPELEAVSRSVDAPYACTTGWYGSFTEWAADFPGHLRVQSHNHAPSAHAHEDRTVPDPSPGTVPKPVILIDPETGEELTPCKGFWLNPVSVKATHVEDRTFSLVARTTWDEVGPPNGEQCDTESDIQWTWLVNGQEVGTGRALTHTFPSDGFFNVTFRAELDSNGYGLEGTHQKQESTRQVYTGADPVVRRVEATYGNLFVDGVTVPGGVGFIAHVEWGAGNSPADGYVVWRYAGKEVRTYGATPVLTLDPGSDVPGGALTVPLTAQAYVNDGRDVSRPYPTRLKFVPFPSELTQFVQIGETKVVKATTSGTGKGHIMYEWEWNPVELELQRRTGALGGVDGEGKFIAGLVIKVKSTGEGAISPQGALEVSFDATRWDATIAGKLAGEGVVAMDDIEFKEVSLIFEIGGDATVYLLTTDLFPGLAVASNVPLAGDALDRVNRIVRIGLGIGLVGETSTKLTPTKTNPCVVFEEWKCEGGGKLTTRLTLSVKSEINDNVKFSAYGRGSIIWELKVPGPVDVIELDKWTLALEAGYTAQVYAFTKSGKVVWSTVHESPGEGFVLEDGADWAIRSRDWTSGGTFNGTDDDLLADLTPFADPAYASHDGARLVAWVQDDPTKPYPRSGDVQVAVDDGAGTWAEVGPLADDELADSSPAVGRLGSGPFVVAWVRDTNASLSEDTPLTDDVGEQLEIIATTVTPDGFVAGATALTSDASLDADPRVVTDAGTGDGVVVWRKNADDRFLASPDHPDDVYAATASAFSFGTPVLAFADVTSPARAFALGSGTLRMADVDDGGNVTLRSTTLDGTGTTIPIGESGDAARLVAAHARFAETSVAWLSENATTGTSDIIETTIDHTGAMTNRTIATNVEPTSLRYVGAFPRSLLWTQAEGLGTAVHMATLNGGSWSDAEVVAASDGVADVLGADLDAFGDATGIVLHDRPVEEGTQDVTYDGANLEEDAPETISVERSVPTVTLLSGRVVVAEALDASGDGEVPPTLEVVDASATPAGDGRWTVTAVLENVGEEGTPAHNGTLATAPYETPGDTGVPVAVPALAAGAKASVSGHVTLPDDATGWWRTDLRSPHVSGGFPALIRMAPEWRLDHEGIERDGTTLRVPVTNAGPVSGTTTLTATALGAPGALLDPTMGADLTADVTVGAGETTVVELVLADATTPYLVGVNLPIGDGPVDQQDFGATLALVEGPVPAAGFLGSIPASAGTHPLDVDLAPFAGVGRFVGATLDGDPLDLMVAGGRLTGSVTLGACPHALEVDVEDGLGGIRRFSAVLDVPGEGCPPLAFDGGAPGPGDGDDEDGDGGNATDGATVPEEEGGGVLSGITNFFRRLVPGSSPLITVLAVALVALGARALGRRRSP